MLLQKQNRILAADFRKVLKAEFCYICIDMHAKEFITYLAAEKHYSVHTLIAYQTDLEQFSNYLQSTYGISLIEDVDSQIIRSWLGEILRNGNSPRSVNRKLSTLKSFFRFLVKRDILQVNPIQKVVAPKIPGRLPLFLDTSRVNQLLDSDVFGNSFRGLRTKMILELLYATGIRVSELTDLKHKHIDNNSLTLTVTGKRNKQRMIPFGAELLAMINEYTAVKEKVFGAIAYEDFLITTLKGKKAYPELIYITVKQNLQLITTQQKKSPHVIRHTFATGMLNNGADLNAVKELLGHASLAATQVYTHNTIERIKRIYQQAHPKA